MEDTFPLTPERNVCRAEIRRGSASLGDEGLDDLDDAVLLATGEALDLLEGVAKLAPGGSGAAGLFLAEDLLNGDAEGLGDGNDQVGAGQVAGAFPVAEVGRLLADLAGEFAQGEARGFAQGSQTGTGGLRHGRSIRAEREKSLHLCNLLHSHVQCNLT